MTVVAKLELGDAALPSAHLDDVQAAEAAEALTKSRRRTAWQVHRWPLERRVARRQVRVHLPRSYLSKDGIDVRVVRAGIDLNLFVYRHYESAADERDREKTNFVSAERVREKKHEFLGPDPRIVGFSYDFNGDVHICWYDRYLDEQWVDDVKWTVLEVEKSGKGAWVERQP